MGLVPARATNCTAGHSVHRLHREIPCLGPWGANPRLFPRFVLVRLRRVAALESQWLPAARLRAVAQQVVLEALFPEAILQSHPEWELRLRHSFTAYLSPGWFRLHKGWSLGNFYPKSSEIHITKRGPPLLVTTITLWVDAEIETPEGNTFAPPLTETAPAVAIITFPETDTVTSAPVLTLTVPAVDVITFPAADTLALPDTETFPAVDVIAFPVAATLAEPDTLTVPAVAVIVLPVAVTFADPCTDTVPAVEVREIPVDAKLASPVTLTVPAVAVMTFPVTATVTSTVADAAD